MSVRRSAQQPSVDSRAPVLAQLLRSLGNPDVALEAKWASLYGTVPKRSELRCGSAKYLLPFYRSWKQPGLRKLLAGYSSGAALVLEPARPIVAICCQRLEKLAALQLSASAAVRLTLMGSSG